jgi:hypothetical protein
MMSPVTRIDLHNAEIDDDAAGAGLCGMTHLATGRCCRLPARHTGSCRFVSPATSTHRLGAAADRWPSGSSSA